MGMFKRILVATDGSELSDKAVAGALDFAKSMNAEVVAVTAIEPYSFSCASEYWPIKEEEYDAWQKKVAGERLEAVSAMAAERGMKVQAIARKSYSPAEVIVQAAKANGCDLIIMASHGKNGLSAMLLGSETQKVLVAAEIPVIVYR